MNNTYKKYLSIYRCDGNFWYVMSLIAGSILGETNLEKRESGLVTIIRFFRAHSNVEYLIWYFNILVMYGLYKPDKPKLYKCISKHNKILFTYRINSYSFSSFNWIYDAFYKDNEKFISKNNCFITPLALAVWFMDSGFIIGKEIHITIISKFNNKDIINLCEILKEKYNLDTYFKLSNKNHTIIIKQNSVNRFINIIKPYINKFISKKLK